MLFSLPPNTPTLSHTAGRESLNDSESKQLLQHTKKKLIQKGKKNLCSRPAVSNERADILLLIHFSIELDSYNYISVLKFANEIIKFVSTITFYTSIVQQRSIFH